MARPKKNTKIFYGYVDTEGAAIDQDSANDVVMRSTFKQALEDADSGSTIVKVTMETLGRAKVKMSLTQNYGKDSDDEDDDE